jgi:hypothetical protein
MNDFAFLFESYRDPGDSLLNVALRLADAPCSPIEMERPNRLTVRLLTSASPSPGRRGEGKVRRQTLRLVAEHRGLFRKLSE